MVRTELAKQTGISRRGNVNAETGASIPRRPTLAAWSLATGVPIEWLETGKTPTGTDPDGGESVGYQGLEPRTR